MIERFKNFDADEFLDKKKALKEAVDNTVENEDNTLEMPEVDSDIPEEEVIIGTPVYADQYLLKIAHIVGRKLKSAGVGDFGMAYNIVYLNDVPGVRFYEKDGDRHIVCCRSTNEKSISVFRGFEVGQENVAIVTYSTRKLGFKDMLDELVSDLKGDETIEESVVNEAISDRYGSGWTEKEVIAFEKLDHDERDFVYSFIRKFGKTTAAAQFLSLVSSGDAVASKIWTKYKGSPEAKGGPVKYMMDMANTALSAATGVRQGGSYQEAVDKGVLDNLISDCKGSGGPAIVTRSEVSYDTGDEVDEYEMRRADMEKKHQAEIEAGALEYEETIRGLRDVTTAMCNYVKQNGKLDRDDRSVMSRRGVLLTGKGGIGKTNTLKQVLKEKHMVINRDYVWSGSGNSTADSVYQLMYEYNGKLLVFDDSPNLFDGDYRVSMWKNSLQTDIEDCLIGYPGKDSKLRVYNVRRLRGDRQKKYFTEIGRKSLDDKDEFYKKEMKKYGIKFSAVSGKPVPTATSELGQEEVDEVMLKIDDRWKDEEANAQPAMPNEFIFTGLVIIISNLERSKFIDEVGKGNWDAISSRFENFDISPKAEALWVVMKKKILEDYNNKALSDEECAIPRDMVEEFITEVESLIVNPDYQEINWRTITMFHEILGGEPGRRTWKSKLKNELGRNKLNKTV